MPVSDLAGSAPRRPVRVLLVDDSRSWRLAVTRLLTGRNYVVAAEAASSAEAFAAATRLELDAALIDVHLPDENGFALARRLTRRDPHLAVLLASVDPPVHAYSLLEASGARGLIDKARLLDVQLDRYWPRPA